MTKAPIVRTALPAAYPLFPQKVKLVRTGEICENQGYYGNLFTLKLPNGRLTEVHRRELDLGARLQVRVAARRTYKSKSY